MNCCQSVGTLNMLQKFYFFNEFLDQMLMRRKKQKTVNRCSQVRMNSKVVFTHDSFEGKKITHRIHLVCITTTISSVMFSLKCTIGFLFVCCSHVLLFPIGLWWFCRKKFKITYTTDINLFSLYTCKIFIYNTLSTYFAQISIRISYPAMILVCNLIDFTWFANNICH